VSTASESASKAPEPVLVHVLFMDIVGSTKYFTDEQRTMVESLQDKVRATSEYRKATAKHELISLPTGDGMALLFLNDVEAPLRCAIELAGLLRASAFTLRMGVHSGPVFIVEDINGQRNASGAGINRAQRVMDCGDGNHILLSEAAADVLRQFRHWSSGLHDIGHCKVKDGWYHVWSYYDANAGNAALPRKSKQLVQRRHMLGASVAAAIAAVLAISAFIEFRNHFVPTGPASERSLAYSVIVKPPKGPGRVYAREMLFPPHYGLKFRFQAVQRGFLYLINEGPEAAQGRTWHWLFPYPAFHDGLGTIDSGETLTVPAQEDKYYELDETSGKETIFVIWSDRQLQELENIKTGVFNGKSAEGALTIEQAQAASAFLNSHQTQAEAIAGENSTTVRTRDSVLIRAIALEHL